HDVERADEPGHVPAAVTARGRLGLGEELQVDDADSAVDHLEDDEEQRDHRQDHRPGQGHGRGAVLEPAQAGARGQLAQRRGCRRRGPVGGRGAHTAASPFVCPRRQTMTRARMLLIIVTRKRATPIAMRAVRVAGVASPKVAAMWEAMLLPVPKRLAPQDWEPPMSMSTAMVSPSARPRPSMAAATIPEKLAGSTTLVMTSQRVDPSA